MIHDHCDRGRDHDRDRDYDHDHDYGHDHDHDHDHGYSRHPIDFRKDYSPFESSLSVSCLIVGTKCFNLSDNSCDEKYSELYFQQEILLLLLQSNLALCGHFLPKKEDGARQTAVCEESELCGFGSLGKWSSRLSSGLSALAVL
jgi:hypothetical protein